MSTPQTDSHHAYQKRIYVNFDTLVHSFLDGESDYDYVEEELDAMREDDDVDANTYERCASLWDEAKREEDFWQEEERRKWEVLRDDSGVY